MLNYFLKPFKVGKILVNFLKFTFYLVKYFILNYFFRPFKTGNILSTPSWIGNKTGMFNFCSYCF